MSAKNTYSVVTITAEDLEASRMTPDARLPPRSLDRGIRGSPRAWWIRGGWVRVPRRMFRWVLTLPVARGGHLEDYRSWNDCPQAPHPHLAWAKQDRERRAADARWLAYRELTGVADTPTERLNWVLKDVYSGPRIADLVYRPNALLDYLGRRP